MYDRFWKVGIKLGFYVYCLVILFFLLFPLLAVFPVSFNDSIYLEFFGGGAHSLKWYKAFLQDKIWMRSLLLSLGVATFSAVIAAGIGTLAAIALDRLQLWGKSLIRSVLLSPLVMPVIVFAVAFYSTFAKIKVLPPLAAIIISHSILGIPLVFLAVSAVLKGFNRRTELAAYNLGAGYLRTFLFVIVPNIKNGIIIGAVFSFLISLDELLLVMFLGDAETTTVSKRMWEAIRYNLNPVSAVVSCLLIVLAGVFILTTHFIGREKENE